jgi:hypothetical protein
MSKGKGRKGSAERRRAQMAMLEQRAAARPPSPRREHIQAVDVKANEEKYEPFLRAIEEGLSEVYEERKQLPIDDEAERALRLLIARFEGDSARRSRSPDVDTLADAVNRKIELLFRHHPLLSRAEIIGCLRYIITSIANHRTPGNPRAYFEWARHVVHERERAAQRHGGDERHTSGLWVPGQPEPREEEVAPRRPGGLWVPGDKL